MSDLSNNSTQETTPIVEQQPIVVERPQYTFSCVNYKGLDIELNFVHGPGDTVTGHTGNMKIDLTELEKIFKKNAIRKHLCEVPFTDPTNSGSESDSESEDTEVYDYDSTSDHGNYHRGIFRIPLWDKDDFCDSVQSGLNKAYKTDLLDIYIRAVRAVDTWFTDLDSDSEQKIVASDLAAVLNPFHEEIHQLHGSFNFGLLNSLDGFFFGLKKAGYWRGAFGLPKIGPIDHSDIGEQVVVTHGICTMQLEDPEETYVNDMIKHNKSQMKSHVSIFVKILDEMNLSNNL